VTGRFRFAVKKKAPSLRALAFWFTTLFSVGLPVTGYAHHVPGSLIEPIIKTDRCFVPFVERQVSGAASCEEDSESVVDNPQPCGQLANFLWGEPPTSLVKDFFGREYHAAEICFARTFAQIGIGRDFYLIGGISNRLWNGHETTNTSAKCNASCSFVADVFNPSGYRNCVGLFSKAKIMRIEPSTVGGDQASVSNIGNACSFSQTLPNKNKANYGGDCRNSRNPIQPFSDPNLPSPIIPLSSFVLAIGGFWLCVDA
jgi:hypothetical protein